MNGTTDVTETRVCDLGLSALCLNAIAREFGRHVGLGYWEAVQLMTVRHLTSFSHDDLLNIRQLGETSVRQVEAVLLGMGLALSEVSFMELKHLYSPQHIPAELMRLENEGRLAA